MIPMVQIQTCVFRCETESVAPKNGRERGIQTLFGPNCHNLPADVTGDVQWPNVNA